MSGPGYVSKLIGDHIHRERVRKVKSKASKIIFRLTNDQQYVLKTAVAYYEKEKTDEAYKSLMTLLDYLEKEVLVWYQRMEFDIKRTPLLPEAVDAFIDLALDMKDRQLFEEYSKLKSKVINAANPA